MRSITRWFGCALLLIGFVAPAISQRTRDPLTDKEVDDLREAAQEPQKRMKLLISFAKARMEMIEHMRSDPQLAGENYSEMHRLLQDVTSLVDEVDDNLDMYDDRSADLRKPLKAVIEMDSEFQLKLRTLKETSTPAQLKTYGFALDTALDAVNESGDSAREMLQDQIAKRGKDKEKDEKEKKERPEKDTKDSGDPKPPCSPC